MPTTAVQYLPLTAEIKTVAHAAHELWQKTYYPLLSSCEDEYERELGLECADANSAELASSSLTSYQALRTQLTYRFRDYGITKIAFHTLDSDPEFNNYVRIHIDDYLPCEFSDVLSHIIWAAAHYYPFPAELISSLKSFDKTFASFDILGISSIDGSDRPDSRDIVALHKTLLKLTRLLVVMFLDDKPVNIEIEGNVKHLNVSIDKIPVKLSPTQIRGVAALALLEYEHWFSVDEFCQLAFPGDAYEPRKQFDAALSVLKQFSPFGWDADEGIRRVKGSVIRSAVDKAILHAYLKQKRGV